MTIQSNAPMMSDYQYEQYEQEEADRQEDLKDWEKRWDEEHAWDARQQQIEEEKEMAWDMLQNMRFEPFEEQAFWDEQHALLD